jgi:hypothetical protein
MKTKISNGNLSDYFIRIIESDDADAGESVSGQFVVLPDLDQLRRIV